MQYPDGKRFAFTIVDDTDCATVANVGPVYECLHRLGFRTTKTVWPLAGHRPDDANVPAQTLADPDYVVFIHRLQEQGFEIAIHGARSYTSTRQETQAGFQTFQRVLGHHPRLHANHMFNRESLYWGAARLDFPPTRWLYRWYRRLRRHAPESDGHKPDSVHYWGDLCKTHIEYVRGFALREVNLLRINPTLPYHDPKRPCVRAWFSATDAANAREFNAILSPENQECLEREGGICIVATHLSAGFAKNGKMNPETERLLRRLAARPGWFVPASELLDFLVERHGVRPLPPEERRRLEWSWLTASLRRFRC